ncbi:MAG: enoyl-CoA hydratase [Alphaproteobacteria bacterium]|nr:enoyl-CoA hydratase [Alphaproteobacteria bacterium]
MSGSGAVSFLPKRFGAVASVAAPRDGGAEPQWALPDETSEVKALLESHPYRELTVEFDPHERVLWYYMAPIERPSTTLALMREARHLQKTIVDIFEKWGDPDNPPIRYLVVGSRMPGIFNLGGDLALFARLIQQRDHKALVDYARLAIAVVHANASCLDLPIITASVVQGDALGGGFEAAVSSNLIIAERSAKFGLPEVLFNMFPGMGAYSLLARRIDPALAERMMLSGQIYSAEELHKLGVVDMLAEDGTGTQVFYDYLAKHSRQFNAHEAIYRVRRRVNPITFEEMADIADIWVETALRLGKDDVHRMERLAAAQYRRWNRAAE